jgi:hypothetical protein
MEKDQIQYRKLKQYKYQLMALYGIQTSIKSESEIQLDYIMLRTDGMLFIHKGYCWDGPSGPTIDTPSFMRGSLIHDALYQLIRKGHISRSYRYYADALLYKICLEDDMLKCRACYVFKSVRKFGKCFVKPKVKIKEILTAP